VRVRHVREVLDGRPLSSLVSGDSSRTTATSSSDLLTISAAVVAECPPCGGRAGHRDGAAARAETAISSSSSGSAVRRAVRGRTARVESIAGRRWKPLPSLRRLRRGGSGGEGTAPDFPG
jgi:hypothetical protein